MTSHLLPLPCCGALRHVTSPAALLAAAAVHVCEVAR